MTGTQIWRLTLAAILGFSWLFLLPSNAYAVCISQMQSQTIAAAYEGDEEPTVHHMDTCSGDDIGYQIPIATSIIFDGVQYSNVYATTNSVITFGSPDPTFWDYPITPSISLYSMDWFPGASGTSGLDIYYSEGGFQINLNMVPFGNYSAQPSTVNILVAITNTGGIAVSYSYQGPQYQGMRTGVRLHDGSIVSLESWGATQISAEEPLPTLQPEPVIDPTSTPEPTPLTPEEQQAEVSEAVQLANEISDLNNLIASINGENKEEIIPEPQPTPEPEVTEEPLPEPDVVVEPEIITPEDPRFPDDEGQIEPDNPNPSPSSDTTNEGNEENDPTPEPSKEPSPQPEEIDPVQKPEQESPADEEVVNPTPDNNNTDNAISEEELKKINKLISENDIKLLLELVKSDENIKQAVEEFSERAEKNKDAPMPYTIADAVTEVKAENLLEDPIGTIASTFTDIDLEVLSSPSEWGKDMTDDQREKAQEVIIPVIIASNIVAAAMTRRK